MITVDQPRLNPGKPMKNKESKAVGRCPDCQKKITEKIRVRFNQGVYFEPFSGEIFVSCENTKCKTKPSVRLTYSVKK